MRLKAVKKASGIQLAVKAAIEGKTADGMELGTLQGNWQRGPSGRRYPLFCNDRVPAGFLKVDGAERKGQVYPGLFITIGKMCRERSGQVPFNLSGDRPVCRRQRKGGGNEGSWTGECYRQGRNGSSTGMYSDENDVFTPFLFRNPLADRMRLGAEMTLLVSFLRQEFKLHLRKRRTLSCLRYVSAP